MTHISKNQTAVRETASRNKRESFVLYILHGELGSTRTVKRARRYTSTPFSPSQEVERSRGPQARYRTLDTKHPKRKVVWGNVMYLVYIHIGFLPDGTLLIDGRLRLIYPPTYFLASRRVTQLAVTSNPLSHFCVVVLRWLYPHGPLHTHTRRRLAERHRLTAASDTGPRAIVQPEPFGLHAHPVARAGLQRPVTF